MTTRDEARRGRLHIRGESRGASGALTPEVGPTLPDRLVAAREQKGVDLYRAERDTKIRARYLAALERGEYRELPGAVYTKGFLRNYALYLGLDPEDVLRQWRLERGEATLPSEPVLAVPKPLAAPRAGLTFSPVIIIAALLTVLIGVFAIYIGIQLVRFAKPPTLTVTNPAQLVIDVAQDATSYTLQGTSIPGATITITAPGRDQPYRVSADAAGRWSSDVDLRRGRNQFDITALDPDTGKQAEKTFQVFITVPFQLAEAPAVTVDSPADGAQFRNGAVPVHGTAPNAKNVTVSAFLLGAPGSQPSASPAASAKPAPSANPAPSASPSGSAAPAKPTVGPVTVDVAADGTFDTPLNLAAGSWQIVVTATSVDGKSSTITRNVTIAFQGVNLTVTIKDARAWLKVWVDGTISPVTGQAGIILQPGAVLTFTGQQSVEVRTGSSSSTYFSLNGVDLGHLSTQTNPETWLFAPPNPPAKTSHT